MWGWAKSILGFFTGGSKSSEKVIEMADEAIHTSQERSETDQKDLSDARAMQMATHDSLFDIFVDGVNRLVRPGVTVWLIGGFIGWWALPKPGVVDPYWEQIFMLIITFWFGGRVILKDLPSVIKALRGK